MKDYSNFIQTPYGFIRKYEIVDNQLFVYTSENEKGKPHIYTATKENISYIDERLGNQYRLILKNRRIIKDEFMKKKSGVARNIGITLLIISLLIGIITSLGLGWALPMLISGLAGFVFTVSGNAIADHMETKFDEELDLYQEYLNNREKISVKKDQDTNVTRYLSDNAANNIKEKEQLRNSGLIEIPFDIDFMDKIKLKDLRNLLTSYYICEDLKRRQSFLVPEAYKTKTKKRVKKNENNNEDNC